MAEMLARPMPPAAYRDKHGRVRVLADVSDHAGLLDAAFNQIRQAGKTHPAILIELAEILGKWLHLPERRRIATPFGVIWG